MRLPLATLEVFDAIVRHGSLRAAAHSLGVKPSTVSHQLKALEERLGTALFIRTTRSLSLTEAGRALKRGAQPAFDQLSDALESARTTGHAARGTLKLTMSDSAYNQLIGPEIKSFSQRYPEIEIELTVSEGMIDLLEQGLHAGFRLGDKIAQNMVAVRLTGPQRLLVTASPEYLEKRGRPEKPEDLLDHNCIRYRFQTSRQIAPWNFKGAEGDYSVEVGGNLIVNTLMTAIDLTKQGLGLLYTFQDDCLEELDRGQLVSVLDEHLSLLPGLYIYFPREYRSMMPLRLFIDHLRDRGASRSV